MLHCITPKVNLLVSGVGLASCNVFGGIVNFGVVLYFMPHRFAVTRPMAVVALLGKDRFNILNRLGCSQKSIPDPEQSEDHQD